MGEGPGRDYAYRPKQVPAVLEGVRKTQDSGADYRDHNISVKQQIGFLRRVCLKRVSLFMEWVHDLVL
jgi:hypothetical protein